MNKTVVMVCITAIIVAVIGLVGWVSYAGGDIERILGWSGTILAPLILSVASLVKVTQVNTHMEEAKQDIRVVKVQTNGKMRDFGDRLDAAEKALEAEKKEG